MRGAFPAPVRHRLPRWTLAALAALAGCPTTTAPEPEPAPPPYTLPERPRCTGTWAGVPGELGRLGDARLVEVSGVVPSPTTADLLWVHNDSGDDAAIYAIHADGRPRGRVTLPFAVRDLEDLAVASCPDRRGPCLYLADTGNNTADRDDTAVYIIVEPVPGDSGAFPDGATATLVTRVDATATSGLPAGLDVEALVVLPDASALLLFEKVDAATSRVFARRGPFDAGGDVAGAFAVVGTVSTESPAIQFGRMITGADLHPTGRSLLLRTYTGIFVVDVAAGADLLALGDVRAATVTFGPFSEPQGEAIAFDAAGTGVITISEARDAPAADVAVNLFACE